MSPVNTSTNVSMTAPVYTRPLTTTATATDITTTVAIISHAVKETAIANDWISQGVLYARLVFVIDIHVVLALDF